MRIALIFLSLIALIFIGSISWSLINQSEWILQKKGTTSIDTPIEVETLKYQIKTEERLEKLNTLVEELAKKNGWISHGIPIEWTASWNSTQSTPTETKTIKISGKFLARIMPTATLSLIENTSGIFGLHIFDLNTQYSTYEDPKMGMKIIATEMTYDTLLKNMYAVGKEVYSINETKWFPMRAFYVNPPKEDNLVRIVFESENQAIAIEIIKTKFPVLKSLLLKEETKNTLPAKKK